MKVEGKRWVGGAGANRAGHPVKRRKGGPGRHTLPTMQKNLPRARGGVCGGRSVSNDLLAAAMGE